MENRDHDYRDESILISLFGTLSNQMSDARIKVNNFPKTQFIEMGCLCWKKLGYEQLGGS